jgi:hypothetical protein
VRAAALALSLILLAGLAHAADARGDDAGWDRTRWGMNSAEIAALYGKQATRLTGRIEFAGLYTDVALRRYPFAGLDFTVYFQMDDKSGRLAQVLLERRRQYATPEAWRAVLGALEQALGPATATCNRRGRPAQGTPLVLERAWVLPGMTVRATFLDFSARSLDQSSEDFLPDNAYGSFLPPFMASGPSRRLLVRYAPSRKGEQDCQ